MSGIKGKNLGTAYHIYDLQAERQTSEYRSPKSSICIYTEPLDEAYGQKSHLQKRPQKRSSMENTVFSIFEHQPGWNKRWMRFAKTALTLRISTEEFKKYFVNNDYDGFREVLRREAKANATWHMRGWNQQWTNLEKKAQKLGVNEELLNDYFEIDDREGFKEILRQKRNDSNLRAKLTDD